MFLYIDPLKQGLKPTEGEKRWLKFNMFLYIDPLKQGLKLIKHFKPPLATSLFLYIDPLKQGLKHFTYRIAHAFIICFYT